MSKTIRMADGDVFVNSAGRGENIEGADKAAQDSAEILMTPLNDADYGSELNDLDVPAPVSVFAGKALISKKVDEAIQRLIRYQQRDATLTDQEAIDSINKMVIESMGSGSYVFWVSLLLKDQTVTADRIIAVSLRHQESARFVETIQELTRRLTKQP